MVRPQPPPFSPNHKKPLAGYTEWEGGTAGRELYWRAEDPLEYRNRAADPALAAAVREAQAFLRSATPPKPGPANRPRALDRDGRKSR